MYPNAWFCLNNISSIYVYIKYNIIMYVLCFKIYVLFIAGRRQIIYTHI